MRKLYILLIILFTAIVATAQNPPKIVKHGNAYQLIVDGKPFLMRAGELGNSNASTVAYFRDNVVGNLLKQKMNTALVPVYWDLIEPTEGKFDFSLVDSIIRISRQNDLKLVLLWFGAWKNSMSCYVPAWVKKDVKRFPRAESKDGVRQEILSPFAAENLKADRNAFCALMTFLKEHDHHQTVLMVQDNFTENFGAIKMDNFCVKEKGAYWVIYKAKFKFFQRPFW
ncbi:MAG: beta-galactosidase, partial [Bacteroidales bacterium]|nr:beta-galactosidase [Bacteroidales bacterium]